MTRSPSMNARRVRLRRALCAVGLELRDDSYLCRLYVAEAAFERSWPTLPDVVRRMCEMEWLHEWTSYHAALRRCASDYRRAEALVLAARGGFPSEWPWQRRAHLLAHALAGLRCRCWLRRWLPRWIERFYDPDRGRYLALAAARWVGRKRRRVALGSGAVDEVPRSTCRRTGTRVGEGDVDAATPRRGDDVDTSRDETVEQRRVDTSRIEISISKKGRRGAATGRARLFVLLPTATLQGSAKVVGQSSSDCDR